MGADDPLVAIQPAGRRPPLFLVHPIGGYVLCYAPLARHLEQGQPLYGLAAAGLTEVPDECDEVPSLARHYVATIRRIQRRGPYLLGGYSFGGVVAFEMACQLRQVGEAIGLLALLDVGAPGVGRWAPDVPDVPLAAGLLRQYARACGRPFRVPDPESARGASSADALAQLLDGAKLAGIAPPDVDVPWVRRFLRGFRTRVGVVARYVPGRYDGPVAIFRAAESDDDTGAPMPGEPPDDADPTSGWSRLCVQAVEVYTVPGRHETILVEPHVRVLAAQLGACLRHATAARRRR